jgi:hypothetical protein
MTTLAIVSLTDVRSLLFLRRTVDALRRVIVVVSSNYLGLSQLLEIKLGKPKLSFYRGQLFGSDRRTSAIRTLLPILAVGTIACVHNDFQAIPFEFNLLAFAQNGGRKPKRR